MIFWHVFGTLARKICAATEKTVVGLAGFEPAASWSRTKRSTKLSHSPKKNVLHRALRASWQADKTRWKKLAAEASIRWSGDSKAARHGNRAGLKLMRAEDRLSSAARWMFHHSQA
jgi:hypothetical protein